jgi:stage II sporulation protein D
VQDKFSRGKPGFAWRIKLSAGYIGQQLLKLGLPSENIEDIIPVQRSSSGRIEKIKIVQKGGTDFLLTGNSFRLILGAGKIKSCNFEVLKKKGRFIFSGNGYGHGSGMSQWGAFKMAKDGFDFRSILDFYYKGLIIKKIDYRTIMQSVEVNTGCGVK